jgi:hypothetical protein
MRRLRAGLVTPPPGGLGSPSVPTKRDCPSVGWTRRGRRRAKACRIGEGAALPSAPGSYGSGDRNRRSGAPRGAPPSPRRRRASPGVSGGFAGRPGACAKPPRFSALRSLKGGADWTTAYPGPPRIRAILRARFTLPWRGRDKKERRVALAAAFWLYPRAFPVGVKRPQSGHPRRSCAGGSVFPACHINRS